MTCKLVVMLNKTGWFVALSPWGVRFQASCLWAVGLLGCNLCVLSLFPFTSWDKIALPLIASGYRWLHEAALLTSAVEMRHDMRNANLRVPDFYQVLN